MTRRAAIARAVLRGIFIADGRGALRWLGRCAPAGLLGLATRADGSSVGMAVARLEDGRP